MRAAVPTAPACPPARPPARVHGVRYKPHVAGCTLLAHTHMPLPHMCQCACMQALRRSNRADESVAAAEALLLKVPPTPASKIALAFARRDAGKATAGEIETVALPSLALPSRAFGLRAAAQNVHTREHAGMC